MRTQYKFIFACSLALCCSAAGVALPEDSVSMLARDAIFALGVVIPMVAFVRFAKSERADPETGIGALGWILFAAYQCVSLGLSWACVAGIAPAVIAGPEAIVVWLLSVGFLIKGARARS